MSLACHLAVVVIVIAASALATVHCFLAAVGTRAGPLLPFANALQMEAVATPKQRDIIAIAMAMAMTTSAGDGGQAHRTERLRRTQVLC